MKINNPDNINFFLTDMPEITQKPRENGLTMMIDKWLGINDTKNFIDMCEPHTDIIKLGFGTSAIYPYIETKIANIDIVGTIATVRLEADNWTGHKFTDFFTLLKVDDEWKIMNKVFYLHA